MSQIQIVRRRYSYPTGYIVRFFGGCLALVEEIRNRRHIRKSLGSLSSRDLRDIGLTVNDVDSANSAPLSQDAATELKMKARLTSASW